MDSIYKNRKTGEFYIYDKEVINATNENDGQVMILYSAMKTGQTFVREKKEFFEKFVMYGW